MPSKIKLTDTAVAKLDPPASGQRDVFDTLLPGFGVRVSSKGTRSWTAFYRYAGKPRRLTLGRHPILTAKEARAAAREALGAAAEGRDPAGEKQQARRLQQTGPEDAFEKVLEKFLARHVRPNNRTAVAVEQLFANHVTPRWQGREVTEITRKDVIKLLDDLQDKGQTTQANRVLANVRKLFNWCVERELVTVSPCAGVKPQHKERQRERVLSESELRDLWQAFDTSEYPFGPAFKLMLLTAQRRGEVANIRWHEVDLGAGLWTIPETKNGRAQEVPLPRQATDLLAGLPRFNQGDYVFSTTFGKRPISGFGKAKDRAEAAVNRRREQEQRELLNDWRLHDLRRTAATGMATLGVPVDHISRVLNHTNASVTAIYDRHSYRDAKRRALQVWADGLDRIIAGKPLVTTGGNVVQLAEVAG